MGDVFSLFINNTHKVRRLIVYGSCVLLVHNTPIVYGSYVLFVHNTPTLCRLTITSVYGSSVLFVHL